MNLFCYEGPVLFVNTAHASRRKKSKSKARDNREKLFSNYVTWWHCKVANLLERKICFWKSVFVLNKSQNSLKWCRCHQWTYANNYILYPCATILQFATHHETGRSEKQLPEVPFRMYLTFHKNYVFIKLVSKMWKKYLPESLCVLNVRKSCL